VTGIYLNKKAEDRLNEWLDAVAKELGVNKRHTMAYLNRWEKACIQAIDGGQKLEDFIRAIRDQDVKYLSPERTLFLTQTKKPEKKKFFD